MELVRDSGPKILGVVTELEVKEGGVLELHCEGLGAKLFGRWKEGATTYLALCGEVEKSTLEIDGAKQAEN